MEYNGSTYFNIDKHITDRRGTRQTEWVYTDIQNFDETTDHIYTWNDATLIGNNTFGMIAPQFIGQVLMILIIQFFTHNNLSSRD